MLRPGFRGGRHQLPNPNQAPTVKLTAPVGGEVWSGKQTIKWTGADPDKDKLSYDVYCSKDGGKNWKAWSAA